MNKTTTKGGGIVHTPKIELIERAASNILRFEIERPDGFSFVPGNAVMIGVPDSGEDPGPFCPTSDPADACLEFFIKIYRERDGLTDRIENCLVGDTLTMSDPFGDIEFQDTGVFLAAGAGITPFLAILRQLDAEGVAGGNQLHYTESNRMDLVQEEEFRQILGNDAHFVLTKDDFNPQRLDSDYLDEEVKVSDDNFYYLCGPPGFETDLVDWLVGKGIQDDKIVREDR
ncbi:MAG: hypothetical protein P1V20_03535 [Verrucomicrobiales bacterium]|nr:hypothetical protein [Verrucomicrobiales bacterium]